MSRIIDADYSQTLMFPPCLEDLVPADHPARFLREFVDALDLPTLGFAQPTEGKAGHPAYAPSLLLKIWLYGYMNRLRSSRQLEKACRENIALLWLAGNHAPDHNTLWRFFRDNRAAMKRLFGQCVRVAADAGLISMALHAVDGTKIASAASNRTSFHRKELEARLAKLEESTEDAAVAVEKAEVRENGSYRLPKSLSNQEALQARIREAMAKRPNASTDSLTDPDSRRLPVDGVSRPGYNAQAVADENRMIVAVKVADAPSDSHQLNPMLDETEATLGETAEETVADTGYAHGPSLAAAEKKGRSVMVSMKGGFDDRLRDADERYHHANFKYDCKNDSYDCPENRKLTFQRETSNSRKTYRVRIYHCGEYASCPVRWKCSANQRGRTIKRNPYEAALAIQREKGRTMEGRTLLRKRKSMIEPVFGTIKETMGFRRFTVWGMESVRAQWLLVATAYNLKKMFNHWREGRLRLA